MITPDIDGGYAQIAHAVFPHIFSLNILCTLHAANKYTIYTVVQGQCDNKCDSSVFVRNKYNIFLHLINNNPTDMTITLMLCH